MKLAEDSFRKTLSIYISRQLRPKLQSSWRGILVWACPSVRPKRFLQRETTELLTLGILYMDCTWKDKRARIVFLRRSCRFGIMPPFRLCHFIFKQPCEQNIWRLTWFFCAYFVNFQLSYSHFLEIGILYRNKFM